MSDERDLTGTVVVQIDQRAGKLAFYIWTAPLSTSSGCLVSLIDGANFVDATAGSGPTVNVIPAPATAMLVGLSGLARTRRRR